MREIVVIIKGDTWDNEDEADQLAEDISRALDKADFDYIDIKLGDENV